MTRKIQRVTMMTGSFVGAGDGPLRLVVAAFFAPAFPPLPVPAGLFPPLLADLADPPRPLAEPLPPRPALPPLRLPPDRLPDVRAPDPVPRPEPPRAPPLRPPPAPAPPEPRLAPPLRAPPGGTLGRITSDDSSL
jgi:hypothetical protein